MSKILAIVKANLIILVRDRKGLLLLIAMPLMMIAILGAALGGVLGGTNIEPVQVLLVNDDQAVQTGPTSLHLGQTLTQALTADANLTAILKVTTKDDLTAAKEQVRQGDYAAVIHFPTDFTQQVVAGKQGAFTVIGDPGRPTAVEIVHQVMNAVADSTTNRLLANGRGAAPEVIGGFPVIERTASGVKPVSAMQYYAAAMAAMFMMITGLARAQNRVIEAKQGTLDRQALTPTAPAVLMAGQLLSHVVVLFTQFLVLLLGTRFAMGVDWGPLPHALLLGLGYAIAVSGVATFGSTLVRDLKSADAAIGLLGMLFGALSGSMFPLQGFGETMRTIAKAIPNYWALQGLTDQMSGLGTQALWLPVMVLCGIGVGLGALGAWRTAAR